MKKLGVFVGERGNWAFFHDLFRQLQGAYEVSVYEPQSWRAPLFEARLNRYRHRREMQRILRDSDVCFFEWASELLEPASRFPKTCRIVTRLHSYELLFWGPRINWDNVDRIILVSKAMRRRFASLYPAHAAKAFVVYNGVSLDRFKPPAHREFGFNVGMLANFHPIKRVYEAVLTVQALKRKGHRPHLHLAGGKWPDAHFDTYHSAVVSAIQRLGLTDDVTLYSHVANTADWLAGIDIFVSNSYWEGQQVALLEALASGCLCLSHFWEGAEEALPNDCLYVTDEELQQKLVEIEQWGDDRRLARQQQMRAIARDRFDVERQKIEVAQIVQDLLSV